APTRVGWAFDRGPSSSTPGIRRCPDSRGRSTTASVPCVKMPDMPTSKGIVAAGHPQTAEVGARILREGGTAADAAVAAALASWVCEPLLTGPAAGAHLLAVPV